MIRRNTMDQNIRERLDKFISKKGLRQTAQRDEIVEVIFASDEHFTPDELFDRLRRARSEASRATVYRTLGLLEEANLIHEIDLGDGHKNYDPNFVDRPTHNHLVCVDRPLRQSLRIEANCDKLRNNGGCPDLIQARLKGKRLPNQKK